MALWTADGGVTGYSGPIVTADMVVATADGFYPDALSGGGGFFRKPFVLPNLNRGEDKDAKRERWIKEGSLPATVVEVERIPSPDREAEYSRKSAKLGQALKRIADERQTLLARIAELEAKDTAKAQQELLRKRQALQYAALQESLVMEQIEATDVAFVAMTVLSLQ